MAIENAKTLNVRIKNKYDSYENWAASSLVLEAGEIAIAHTAVDVQVDNGTVKHPALLMKVGDGENSFANLPWLSAKAADVLSVCKNADDLKEFVDGVIADAGIASSDAMEDLADRVATVENDLNAAETGLKARVATVENAIAILDELVGDESVATQIRNYVDGLNLADTYAAKDHNHTKAEITDFAHEHAIADVTGLQDALNGLQAKGDYAAAEHGHEIADVDGLQDAINDAKQAGTDAQTYAEGVAGDLATLSGKVGEVPADKTVVQMIADAQAAATYDDTALAGRVGELETLVGDEAVADQIANAFKNDDGSAKYALASELVAEAETARAAEKANADAITKLNANAETEGSVDYKIAQKFATLMENPDEAMNSIQELVDWTTEHAEDALEMSNQVTANKNAIATLNGDAETDGSVAKQVAAGVTEAKGYTDDKVKELADGAVATNAADIAALEGLVGDTAVATQITEAIDGALMVGEGDAKIEKYALATALAATDAEVAKKANTADLAVIAFSGSTDDLIQGELVLVFDCGTSAV